MASRFHGLLGCLFAAALFVPALLLTSLPAHVYANADGYPDGYTHAIESALYDGPAELLNNLAYIRDTNASLTPEQALAELANTPLKTYSATSTPFGYTSDAIWLLLPLQDIRWSFFNTDANYLTLTRSDIDTVDLFLFDGETGQLTRWQHGDTAPISARATSGSIITFPLLPIITNANRGDALLLRAHTTTSSLHLDPMLMSEQQQLSFEKRTYTINVLLIGLFLMLALYNLVTSFFVKNRRYLYYIIYIVSFAVCLAATRGYFLYVNPDNPGSLTYLEFISAVAGIGAFALFVESFLNLKKRLPFAGHFIRASGFITIGCAVLPLFFYTPYFASFLLILNLITIVVAGYAMITMAIRYGILERLFLLAVIPTVFAATLQFTIQLGYISTSPALDLVAWTVLVLEGFLLSSLMAYRFNLIQRENIEIQQAQSQKLEQEVQKRTQSLNQALEARDEFLAVMSHEIRTPLNGILGTVDILGDSKDLNELQDHIQTLEKSGRNLLSLINDVLDYSRIESGNMPVHIEPFNIEALINEIHSLFADKAALQHTVYTSRVELSSPWREGDPLRIRQIIQNLVSNAIKFTEHGTVTVAVTESPDDINDIYITVSDTGMGIPFEDQQAIFGSFQQGSQPKAVHDVGSGLGLAISKNLIDLMGGEVTLTSAPDKGTRFWVRLPMALADPIDDQSTEEACPALPSCDLLIVDDNDINLKVAASLAEKLGHRPVVADSAEKAFQILIDSQINFDCILMDCEMPEIDGFMATQHIRTMQEELLIADIPIIALSAHVEPDNIAKCYLSGMDFHLAKPVRKASLQQALAAVIFGGLSNNDISISK